MSSWLTFAVLLAPIVLPVEPTRPFVPEGRPLEGLVIVLDAGHGGASHDQGYSGSARGVKTGVVEQDLNMRVTAQLYHHLRAAGAQVHLTRRDDRRMTLNPEVGPTTPRAEELGARVRVAEAVRAHLFLSLHHNWARRASANGVVILIWPTAKDGSAQPLEVAFADALRDEVEKVVPDTERFNHYQIEHPLAAASDIPSAVVEFGFLSHATFDEWVSALGAHRAEAIGAYRAIVRIWSTHRESLDVERSRLFPDVGASLPSIGEPEPFEDLARALLPASGAVNTSEDAAFLLRQWVRTTLSDRTTFWFRAEANRVADGWRLEGATSHPIVAEAATRLLTASSGLPVESAMRVLPDAALGDRPYALVASPMALTWAEPREGASVQTQVLLGEPLFLLDRSPDGAYFLAHAADGYLGWVRRDALVRMNAVEFGAWTVRPMVRVSRDVMLDDFRVPAGALLPLLPPPVRGSNLLVGDEPGAVGIELPKAVRGTGGQAFAHLPRDAVRLPQTPSVGRLAAEAAANFLTTPYLFGGRSQLGLDCSGLTSVAWASAGVTIPRDAFQQALMGRLVATQSHRDGLLPGDLLFFLDVTARVFHVGIWIGDGRFLHATPPEVQVTSLDPGDPLFSPAWARTFSHARRISE